MGAHAPIPMHVPPSLIVQHIIDFNSFEVNVYPLKEQFEVQGWIHFFDILHGPTYPCLVKYLWVRAEVYDEVVASFEEIGKIVKDEANKGKSRDELSLKEFKEV